MALLDFFRRRTVPPTVQAGVGGAVVHAGYVQENETNPVLIGREKYRTYSEILANTSIIAAGVRYFLNLVSKASWTVEPAPDSGDEGKRVADLVSDVLFKKLETPWSRVVRRSAMYRFYGYSLQEWTANHRKDGSTGFFDIEPRPQITIERWDVDPRGTVVGVVQRNPQDGAELYLPRRKLVYMWEDSLHNTPEGLGLFRHLVKPAQRLARIEQLEGWGYELDLAGVPIGRAPFAQLERMLAEGLISKEQKLAIEEPIKTFITQHIRNPALGIVLDSITYQSQDEASTPSSIQQWGIDLLKSGSTSQAIVGHTVERINREIARVLGVESMLLGETGTGSLALARDKSQNLALVVDSTLTEIRETYEKDILEPLRMLNGWDDKVVPTLKTEPIKHRSVEEITQALQDLASAGAVLPPDDPVINAVRDLMGLPRQSQELVSRVITAQEDRQAAILPEKEPDAI